MKKLLLTLVFVFASFLTISSAPAGKWSIVCERSDSATGAVYTVMTSDGKIKLRTYQNGVVEYQYIDVVTAINVCNMQ
jgi:hypothetical protein